MRRKYIFQSTPALAKNDKSHRTTKNSTLDWMIPRFSTALVQATRPVVSGWNSTPAWSFPVSFHWPGPAYSWTWFARFYPPESPWPPWHERGEICSRDGWSQFSAGLRSRHHTWPSRQSATPLPDERPLRPAGAAALQCPGPACWDRAATFGRSGEISCSESPWEGRSRYEMSDGF